jgi:hypothetical protein
MIGYWVGMVVGGIACFVVFTGQELGWRWWVPYAINCPMAAAVGVLVKSLLA